MTRGRLAVHAHFYQPSRLDPWTDRVPAEPSAAPYHDWNQRVAAECYRPNADSATAIAQPYHHSILPLASAADRRTEIAWGLRDFELRFGHRPAGLWLPETAVDRETLREAAADRKST